MYAVVVSGVVVNLVEWDGESSWTPDVGEAVEAPDHVMIGWGYAGGVFYEIPMPVVFSGLPEAKASKIAELKKRRDQTMMSGVTINGIYFYTNREDVGIYNDLLLNEKSTINFKTRNGFISLTKSKAGDYFELINDFIQDCFDREKFHFNNINALTTIAAVTAYDINTGWPATVYTGI